MRDHPGFQHPPELDVTLRRRQQLVVLVAARDVHLDLSVCRDGGVLVYALIFGLNVSLRRGTENEGEEETLMVKTTLKVCLFFKTGFSLHLDAEQRRPGQTSEERRDVHPSLFPNQVLLVRISLKKNKLWVIHVNV